MGKFRIGEFEELLVLAVAGLGDDAYGITIQRRLEKQAQRFVPLGAIYAALIRLEEKGLLKSKWGGTSGKRGGRRKRLYKVTEEGMTALADSRSVRETMWRDILKLQPKESPV
jgi:DNA-binding PadR family transcriptional regulator